ncbi:FAR1-related sequence 5-like protein [Tanacetum coccineum]
MTQEKIGVHGRRLTLKLKAASSEAFRAYMFRSNDAFPEKSYGQLGRVAAAANKELISVNSLELDVVFVEFWNFGILVVYIRSEDALDGRESSMSHDPHDMGESSMHRDAQVDNQIVILPEDLQHPAMPTPNGTPYWVPDVPEDEKPKKGRFYDNFNDAFKMYRVYSQKARFNIRKAEFKRKNGQITHSYVECNRAGKPRRSKEVNSLNEVDGEDVEIPGNKKRKCRTKSQAINCPAKLCLKRVIGTETYMVLDFVENHNHPLMNLNNMDLSKARRQLHFDDYIFIHRASLSNLGPNKSLVLKLALVGGYGYKFVPFTGIDHHQKCVTFGAALLSDETIKSLVLGDLAADTKFRKDFHKLVWNVYIGPEVFEQRWDDMITRYNLHDNKWLSDMYAIRERWVPGYFKEFMLCFESAMEKQRYTQRVLDNALNGSTPSIFTELPFEKHSCAVIDKIPDAYLNRRWTKNVLAAHLLDKRHRYGPCIKETDKTQTLNVKPNKEALYADLLGVIVPDKVVIKTPRSIFRSKGTRRMKSAAEIGKAKTIARTNKKVPFKQRTCSTCGEAGHHKGICKKFPNQDKDEVDDEDKGDNEDEVDDEDGVDNEDEVDDEDEVDEEYESEEE